MSLEKMLLIVKPGDNKRFEEICGYLKKRKCDFDTEPTKRPKHAWELAYNNADKYDLILSVGGDGTFNEVVNGVLSSKNPDVVLGVVPLGRGNDYVRNYGIKDHHQALEALLSGNVEEVDLGLAEFAEPYETITGDITNIRYYANLASVGIGAKVAYNANKYFKRLGGTLGYFLSVPWTLAKEQCFEMSIKADGSMYEGKFWEVQANIGVYVGGGMKATPHADMYDGLLAGIIAQKMGKKDFLWTFITKVYHGTHLTHPKVDHFNAKRVWIIADDLWVNLDGESVGKTPVVFSVIPKALRLKIKEFPV